MKQFYRYFVFSLICICFINLVGCCGSSGGGSKDDIINLPDAVAGNDGSLYYDQDGFRLSAMPGTFDPKAVIKVKKQNNNQLESLQLNGKGVSAASALYLLDFQTSTKLLYNMATATLILDSALSTNKKGYFGLERSSVKLVTSEQQLLSSNARASANNSVFNLPFLETFTKIALVTVDKEKLSRDPTLSTDNSQKDVENSSYNSNTHVELDVSTVDTLDNSMTHGKNASVKLLLKGENVEFYKTASRLSTKFQETSANDKLFSASIDLFENSTMVALNNHAVNFNLDLNSAGINYADLPRRLVLEGCYTGSDNLPICSQEYVIFYNSPIKPYVISTSPADSSTVHGLTKITVNFSEPMNPDTVTCTIKSSNTSDKPTLTNYTWNGYCLSMNAKLGSKGVYTVTVNKNATSKTGTKLAKSRFGENSDYTWSFTYDPQSFFVELTTPPHGSTNVKPYSDDNTDHGPDIVLTFSEDCLNYSDSVISLTQNGKAVKYIPHPDRLTYILTPDDPLEFMTEYTIKVSKSISSLQKHTLTEDYIATFTTSSGFASGNGTSASPFLITKHEELANVGNKTYVNKNYYFKVANDIKFEQSLNGFKPIGNKNTPFTGHFDGNNKTIGDFVVNVPSSDNIGIFGAVSNSSINNVTLANTRVLGHKNIGILAGSINNTKINNIAIKNPYIENSSDVIGGIIGCSDHSSITDTVITSAEPILLSGNQDMLGGIVGCATETKIIRATIDISLVGGDQIGGVAGYLKNSVIQNCNAKVSITGGEHNVGGIVGLMSGSTVNSVKVLENSIIKGNNSTGGLIGEANTNSEILKTSVAAKSVSGADNVGGLIGRLINSSMENSCVFNSMQITATGNQTGGLAGRLDGKSRIFKSYTNASVLGNDDVGGLVGESSDYGAKIENSVANNALVQGSTNETMHRITGNGSITITNAFAIDSTVFRIVAQDPKEAKPGDHETFNGKTISKQNLKKKFIELGFESSIWDFSSETPTLK